MSVACPGGNPTMIRTGFAGYTCPCTPALASASAAARTVSNRCTLIGNLPLGSIGRFVRLNLPLRPGGVAGVRPGSVARRLLGVDHAELAELLDHRIVEPGFAQQRLVVLAHARRGALREADAGHAQRIRDHPRGAAVRIRVAKHAVALVHER